MVDKTRGLFEKFHVERIDGKQEKHENCFYFVLDTIHDPFALPALAAYAKACYAAGFELLADDLEALVARDLPMTEVESSNVEAVAYVERRRALRVRFNGGATYEYLDVPREVYDALMAAESKGGFLNREVKPIFEFVRWEL